MGPHGACPASVSPLTTGAGGSDRGQGAATIPTPLPPGLQLLFHTPDSPRGSFPFPLSHKQQGGHEAFVPPARRWRQTRPCHQPPARAPASGPGAAGRVPRPGCSQLPAPLIALKGKDGTGRDGCWLPPHCPTLPALAPGSPTAGDTQPPALPATARWGTRGHGPTGDKEMLTHWGDHASRWLCAVDFHLPGHAGDLLPFD